MVDDNDDDNVDDDDDVGVLTSVRSVHTDHAVTAVLIAGTLPLVARVGLCCGLLLQQLLNLLLNHPRLLHVVLGVGHQVVVVAGGVDIAAVQRGIVPVGQITSLELEDFSLWGIISFVHFCGELC